ncbi:MAG: hypothetical protein ACP5OA_01540 [Candidatus Woesearchaeota archaeon]
MQENMRFPKPINIVEKKILRDKEFLTAVKIGRPRNNHDEGTIKMHIIQILSYIDKNYSNTRLYTDLRIIALLHDVGKFAFLEKRPEAYLPITTIKSQKKLIIECRKFEKKYYTQDIFPKNIRRYKYTAQHSYASYQFAKKFLKDQRILKIIRYHDLAVDMKIEYENQKTYDVVLFKKIFSDIDIQLYLAFLKCDNSNRTDKTSGWLQTELKKHHIII